MSERSISGNRQFLVQMHGEPGSGKSTLALAIGRELPAVVLDKDLISSGLLRTGLAKGSAGPGSYEALWALTRSLLEQGYSVIVDSPAYWPVIEERGRGIARALGARYAMAETRCDDRTELARRLQTRERLESQPHEIVDWGAQAGIATPTCERLILDATRPPAELAAEALAYLRALAAGTAPLLRTAEGPATSAATRYPGREYREPIHDSAPVVAEGENQYAERPSDTPHGPSPRHGSQAVNPQSQSPKSP